VLRFKQKDIGMHVAIFDWANMPSFQKMVLNKQVLARQHNGGTVKCHGKDCSKELEAGDTVYSHYQQRHPSAKTVYYCPSCFEGLWIG
jgi:hypothetical protein